MVTPQGNFKGETGNKWHMIPIVDKNKSCLEVRKWVGKLLGVFLEEEVREEG